ncbi:MAG TPA: guanine permease [Gammaproteobacteria bacterium]|jgi:AGZA family xanthine/uracil permease-like MFS transporter|nr:guanine permease [Gammaproteobacteria bacterium]HCG70989.1 guanine permease [Gammaproteobacteria bacterium]
MGNFLNDYFDLVGRGTTVSRELNAGLTTFLAMAYITVVNPLILSDAGMDFGAVFVATCTAAAFGCLVMGLLANYPVGLAPGMGQNAFFTYAVVIGSGQPWQAALGAVFISGILFVLISLSPLRAWLINSIPRNLKLGMAAGIGFFLAFIALKNAGVVVPSTATFITLGDLKSFAAVMALLGFFAITAMAARGIRSAVIIGMGVISLIAWFSGQANFVGVIAAPPSMQPVFMQLDIVQALDISMLSIILTLLLVDLFDTAGTLVAVATRAKMVDAEGRLRRLNRALIADSSATVVGALMGTSSTTSYVESAAGVESGGRTGLTAVVIGALFLLCLLFAPLAQSIPAYAAAAALLFVSGSMAQSLLGIDWEDITEATPAIITALMMPFSFSIADGIGIGFISFVIIKAAAGRYREIPAAIIFIAAVFAAKFAFI